MAETAEATAAEVALWVDAYSQSVEQLKQSTAQATQAAWLSFEGWYDEALVIALAREMAQLSAASQQTAAGMTAQYVAGVSAAMGTTGPLPGAPFQTIRSGVALSLVHRRPAEAYKRAIATGSSHEEALVKAGLRAAGLALSDVSLQEREVARATMQQLGISTYRRVIHPEMSESGTCGLCIVAADQVYKSGDLMPLHPPSCKCTVAPIIGDQDPGSKLNRNDLDKLYAEAGSNRAEDLRRTRYQVNQHGELGPVLTKAQDSFRGPDKVALENDPERAARMLDQTLPVLARLEAAGGPAGPLQYQRDLVAKLRRIAAAA